MTKTRSGDEEDNTQLKYKYNGILKEKVMFNELMLSFDYTKLRDISNIRSTMDATDTMITESTNIERQLDVVYEVNAMFANLGEAYGNKPKSLAHLMFNT